MPPTASTRASSPAESTIAAETRSSTATASWRAAEAYARGGRAVAVGLRPVHHHPQQWNTIRGLGHRDDLQRMAAEPCDPLMHWLHIVDGWNRSHYT